GDFRHPEKHAVLFALAAAPLAALGVDAARRLAPLAFFPLVALGAGSVMLHAPALVARAHRPLLASELTGPLLTEQLPRALLLLALAAVIASVGKKRKRVLLAACVA